jgi:hypothetical protein
MFGLAGALYAASQPDWQVSDHHMTACVNANSGR